MGWRRLLPWVLLAMVVLVANADEKPAGTVEHDESLREGTRIEQLLSQILPAKSYLPHKLQKAAERLEPQYKADGHMVSLQNLLNEDTEVQNLGEDEYYGEYTYGEAADSSVAMLQMGEGDQQQRYPWVISQREAQKREKRLEKQQAAKHQDAVKLHSHDIPLRDSMDGTGVRERVQRELKEFEQTHSSKGASLQQHTTDRVSSLGDSESADSHIQSRDSATDRAAARAPQRKQVHQVDDTWKRETEGGQYKQKQVHDQYKQKRVRDFDDSIERDTMNKVRSLGEDAGDQEQRPSRGDSDEALPAAIRHHAARSRSAWGDDADDQDDDDDDPFDYLELLQTKQSSSSTAAAPDMISELAHQLKHKKQLQFAHEMQQHEKLQTQGVQRNAESSIKAQQSFTSQLEHQTAHRARAANAGTGDMAQLVKNRHQQHSKTLGRFVPKNQVEKDHNNEIAREVAMQQKLASSFKLAMLASTRKHASVSGNLKKTEQVRDLFNSNSDGITLKVAQKLQPELKNKDDSWKADVAQEMSMAKQAAAFMSKEQAAHDEASKKKHNMKELFPDRAPAKAKTDETGMKIQSTSKVAIPADAQQAIDMQKMMTKATITSNGATEGLIDADGKKLQLSGVTGKALMKQQLKTTTRHFRNIRPSGEAGRPAQPEVKASPLKHKISGGEKALKLAQQFLSKTQVSKASTQSNEQEDPVGRNGILKMLAPKHKKQAAAIGKKQHRLQEAQQQAAVHSQAAVKLSAEDAKQMQMQQQMAQQMAKQSAAVELKEEQAPGKERNIESLFKPTPTKQTTKSASPLLSKEDRNSENMQQQFLKAQKSRKSRIENDKTASPDSRAGVEQLLSVKAGASLTQHAQSGTSEADRIADEFATEKKMQMSLLLNMKTQQQKVAKAQSGVDTKPQSESDLRSLFAVRGKNKASANSQWSKQQVHIAAQKAEHKQVDESLKLENHLHAVEEVAAPKIVQTAVQPAVQPLSLAQQDAGAIGAGGPAAMRKKFTQNMRSHFIELLEHNKDKFKSMMSKQGVGGASSFYKNMKTDLQAMLQPQSDVLIETAAGKDTINAAPATVTPVSKPAVDKKPGHKAPIAAKKAKAKSVKSVKTNAVKAVKAKSAPVEAPAVQADAAQLGDANSAAKPTAKMDLKTLENAVDMLSPEDRQKFIMHRLTKLAS